MKPTHYLIIGMVICIVILLGALIYFKDRADIAQAASDRRESIIREKNDSLHYERNKNGILIAEKSAAEVTTKEALEFYAAELKEIKEQTKINARDIKAFVKAEFQAHGEGNAAVTPVIVTNEDGSTQEMTDFHFSDSFLTFDSRILTGESTAPSQYTYTDKLTFAFHTKKDHWWSLEKLYGTGYLSNPNARITKATEVMVDNYKDKRWGIGFSAGFGAMIVDQEIKVGPVVQVGLTYNIIKF